MSTWGVSNVIDGKVKVTKLDKETIQLAQSWGDFK